MTTHRYERSTQAHQQACRLMPGGVSSPVRAFKSVGRDPVTVVGGCGAWIEDIDGNRYVDYVMSYGPLLLGHAPQRILEALAQAMARGTSFGMTTEAEIGLARRVVEAVPSVQQVRFVNSGTEACMSAVRLARAATGRTKVIKCTGCYHGHVDGLLVEAGSGAMTLGVPSSPGVPPQTTAQTLLVPFNSAQAVREVLEAHPGQVALVAVEPVAGNMGCVPPEPGYLAALREVCDAHGTLLLFDEVMTGFRVAYGGAQSLYGVDPDLTCLGKVLGAGLPCAAYGGRADLMAMIAPQGPVYQAGTLSGNPLAMAAGTAMLDALATEQQVLYAQLEQSSGVLAEGLQDAAEQAGVRTSVQRVGSMLSLFFLPDHLDAIVDYETARQCRTDRFARFFNVMLDEGVMLAPSQFEAWFLSTAHDQAALDHTLAAARKALVAAATLC